MRVRIHRGAHEIGGSCVELECDGARLVLDVGKPLTAGPREHVPLPAVPGLADGADRSLLGVLVSHPHLDHYGLVDQVHRTVPVLAGREAAALVSAARFFSPMGPELRPSGHLEDRRPLRLGPFTVTPHLVDHSGFDSYALQIDAGGRRLLYTGDLRGHGRKAKLFERMVTAPPAGVDTLLMEGTHVRTEPGEEDEARLPTETEVELAMAETFRATPGLPVVVSSAQNIDRLVTVYRAARRSGRILLVDLYTATVAQAIGRRTIPQPGFPRLGVFIPRRQRVLVKQSGEFHRTAAVRALRVFPEQLLADPARYVILTGSSAVSELLSGGQLRGGVVVWSLWAGYLTEPSGQRLVAQAAAHGVPLVHHHTSGHAPLCDLKRLVAALKPGRIVPIHTEGAQQYARHFPRVSTRNDDEWWQA
ncbi:MAG: beta-lactamase domain protein [Streptosporangiaceae bacterium]|nr:beta-lactamase domain protein [Streptosporangiaceae bacterium]